MNNPIKSWRRQKNDREYLGKTGTVLSWTTIHIAPPSFGRSTPYLVVLVKLDSGEMIYGQMADSKQDQMKIGIKVQSTLRRMGAVAPEEIIAYGIKFRILP